MSYGLLIRCGLWPMYSGIPTAKVEDWLDKPSDDGLASYLVQHVDAGDLSRDVVLNTIRVILQARFQTASRLLASGMLAQLRIPAALRQPVDTDIAVNELVRFAGPVHAESRACVTDTLLGGRTICRGEIVTCLLGAANRDPAVFASPNSMSLGRTPNRHLAFGRGPHACLGAPFAVQIARAAFAAITQRYLEAELISEPRPRPNVTERGLYELVVSLNAGVREPAAVPLRALTK